MSPTVGQQAPDFSLSDQQGNVHTLSENKGKWVFLYFYPKDDTPGCTVEACSVRDNWSEFKKMGVEVFGVSADTVESHDQFAQKFDFSFPILSDPEKKVITAYGAWGEKNMYGKKSIGFLRISFLIDPDGKIKKTYLKVQTKTHIAKVLQDLQSFM